MPTWSANTRKRERPQREVVWTTPLRNGDIQVIFEEDCLDCPNPYYPSRDPRQDHAQRYYLGMWNEGGFEPMMQVFYDFDVRRFLVGFDRLEAEANTTDVLCGLFRKQGIDQRQLFQRGYAAAFLSYERYVQEMDGSTTREWTRGYNAGKDDEWLTYNKGYVNTGRKDPSCMEPLEIVQWLF